ncbi:MAG TPA: inorganic phosphate transporter [Chloroflexota bacterium]|nr:inorganic phosphate transporter [Chloroflexota bacterium]
MFEFVNGFHDAANAVATVIATRVLPPAAAVLMAAVMNFLGAISGTAIATTVGKGIVDPHAITQITVAAGLIAAILWDLTTWWFGLPTSSSHALLFGLLGAAIATAGPSVIVSQGVSKTLFGIGYSPIVGLLGAALIMVLLYRIFFRVTRGRVNAIFGRAQLLSSAYAAFSHGGNDGQKTMGVIALALVTFQPQGTAFSVPLWVILSCAVGMALGTAAGGQRIIRTMGFRLAKLDPIHGFAAETAAATVIEVATRLGIPISTTHAVNGAILGVGSVHHFRAVRWGVAANIVAAWVLTVPSAFVLGWLLMQLARLFGWA